MSKEVVKVNEIRMVRLEPSIFQLVKKLAKENKRTLGNQAMLMLKDYIEIKNLK